MKLHTKIRNTYPDIKNLLQKMLLPLSLGGTVIFGIIGTKIDVLTGAQLESPTVLLFGGALLGVSASHFMLTIVNKSLTFKMDEIGHLSSGHLIQRVNAKDVDLDLTQNITRETEIPINPSMIQHISSHWVNKVAPDKAKEQNIQADLSQGNNTTSETTPLKTR